MHLGKELPRNCCPLQCCAVLPQHETGPWSALSRAQSWHSCVPGQHRQHSRGWHLLSAGTLPACLPAEAFQTFPLLGAQPLPGNLLQEKPCALHTTPALEEILCTGNPRSFLETKPSRCKGCWCQAQGSGSMVSGCCRSSQVLPVALQLAQNTLWESRKQPLC